MRECTQGTEGRPAYTLHSSLWVKSKNNFGNMGWILAGLLSHTSSCLVSSSLLWRPAFVLLLPKGAGSWACDRYLELLPWNKTALIEISQRQDTGAVSLSMSYWGWPRAHSLCSTFIYHLYGENYWHFTPTGTDVPSSVSLCKDTNGGHNIGRLLFHTYWFKSWLAVLLSGNTSSKGLQTIQIL